MASIFFFFILQTNQTSSYHFELTPESKSAAPKSSKSSRSTRQTPMNEDASQTPDLSHLCNRRLLLATRSNPWVYRYKVKKSLNDLNRILSSSMSLPADYWPQNSVFTRDYTKSLEMQEHGDTHVQLESLGIVLVTCIFSISKFKEMNHILYGLWGELSSTPHVCAFMC